VGGVLRRVPPSKAWREGDRRELSPSADKRLLDDLARGDAVRLRLVAQEDEGPAAELTAPAVAVPVIIADQIYAVAMYGPHETGDDLDRLEVKSLERLAQQAAIGYETARMNALESEVHLLRAKLAGAAGGAA